jgi:hypothetical protein
MPLTDRDTTFNYLGELFLVGAYQTPFLNMIGGMGGARAKQTRSMIFPVAQPYTLGAAAIPAIDEDALVATGTAETFARGQDLNTVMIFKQDVEVSYLRQAAYGELTGLAAVGNQPVTDEFAFQKMAALKKVAIDMELAFLTGVYAAAVNSSTPAQTRGIITATATNAVAAAGALISKALLDSLFRTMAANGALFENLVLFCNAFQKQGISNVYGYAPEDRNVGGVNIKQIETDFGMVGIAYDPSVPTNTIEISDMNYVSPVFLPCKGQSVLYEDLAQLAGSQKGQIITFAGIDYGPEEYHGKITGLKVV